MDTKEQRQALIRPQLMRLKDLGAGFHMKRVLGDRILISPIEPFTEMDRLEKEGLLVAPEKAKDANKPMPTMGRVIMVGPEVPTFYEYPGAPPTQLLEPGDIVMHSKFAGMDVELNGESFKLLRYPEVACVIEEDSVTQTAIGLVAG